MKLLLKGKQDSGKTSLAQFLLYVADVNNSSRDVYYVQHDCEPPPECDKNDLLIVEVGAGDDCQVDESTFDAVLEVESFRRVTRG